MGGSNSDLMLYIRGRIVVGVLLAPLCLATDEQRAARDLTEASLEDLMNIEVAWGLDAASRLAGSRRFEISLIGQNLRGGRHQEFIPAGPYSRSSAGPSLMVRLTWGI